MSSSANAPFDYEDLEDESEHDERYERVPEAIPDLTEESHIMKLVPQGGIEPP